MSIDITEEQIHQFEEDGVICLRGAIPMEWIERLREVVEEVLAHPSKMALEYADKEKSTRFLGDQYLWIQYDTLRDYIFESPAVEIAARLMRSRKVNFFFDHLLVKEPGAIEPTPWHQDAPYWKVKGHQIVSVWVGLDPVTDASGAVRYVKGSHRWGKWYAPQSFAGDNRYHNPDLEKIPDIDATIPADQIVCYALEPGDCVVHHAETIHGARGNLSSSVRRRGYATRWCGDDVVYDPRDGTPAILRDPGIPAGAPLDCELYPVVQGPECKH